MNVGFVWIYHWGGLYEQKGQLQKICLDNNLNPSELLCDGNLDFCYTKERRNIPGFITCAVCKYRKGLSTITKNTHNLNLSKEYKFNSKFAISSLNTLIDCEDPKVLNNPKVSDKTLKKIFNTQKKLSYNLNKFLDKEDINFVCTLNGRMDVLRLTHEDLYKRNIPFICFERSFLNLGLALYPNINCQNLSFLNKLTQIRNNITLSGDREKYVLNCIKQRTKGSLKGEYASFKKSNISLNSISKKIYKISFILSSESETYFDRGNGWESFENALRSIIEMFGNDKICVKGHPLWKINIQGTRSTRSEYTGFVKNDDYYASLCKKYNVEYISSYSTKTSLEVAKESKLVVLQNSTIFFELSLLNIPILCIRAGFFDVAQSVIMASNQAELDSNSNLIKEIINSKNIPLDPIKTIKDAVNIFHVLAFDMPVLHKNVCESTNDVRKIAFKEMFGSHNKYEEMLSFYELLI